MVITLPNRDLAAIIQGRQNCSRAEPQNNSLTGTSPTRDALVSDEYASKAYRPLSTLLGHSASHSERLFLPHSRPLR